MAQRRLEPPLSVDFAFDRRAVEARHLIVDLLRDTETLGSLQRIHDAFGEAIRQERMLRETDSLDH